jgi:hypothetical protein
VHGVFTLRELGFSIFATEKTHAFLKRHNIHATLLNYPNPSQPAGTTDPAGILNYLRDRKIDLVINMPNADSAQLVRHLLIPLGAQPADSVCSVHVLLCATGLVV